MPEPTTEQFSDLISSVTRRIAGKPLDKDLESELNASFPPHGEVFAELLGACRQAIEAGWMCNREAGGIKYGRVLAPDPATHGFSVDVVEMTDVEGPHHRHPNGEIDLIMPLSPDAGFDGRGAGWLVYEPGSGHRPTVSQGTALILYLLPHGAIEFTGT